MTDGPPTGLLPTEIVDGNLSIRRWTADDIATMEAMIARNLEHLRPWMAWAHDEPITREQRRRLFRQWDRHWRSGRGAVYALRVDAELLGGCAVHRRTAFRGAEIGYWLSADASGRGVATRCAQALTDAAFGLADIDIVQISHERANVRSGAVARRLGFVTTDTDTAEVTQWRVDRARWQQRCDA